MRSMSRRAATVAVFLGAALLPLSGSAQAAAASDSGNHLCGPVSEQVCKVERNDFVRHGYQVGPIRSDIVFGLWFRYWK